MCACPTLSTDRSQAAALKRARYIGVAMASAMRNAILTHVVMIEGTALQIQTFAALSQVATTVNHTEAADGANLRCSVTVALSAIRLL